MDRKNCNTRSNPRGTIIFYTVYLLMILIFVIAMSFVLKALNNWLVSFEASQPNVKCQQVFQELFADPDWAALYDMAGVEDTAFENADTFAAYMNEHAEQLSYVETSAGLSGDKKYIVRSGSDKVATFTLTTTNKDAEIPDWQLGEVALFFERKLDVTILADPDCTVTVNGVELDDSYTLRSISTEAENYLPEGIHGYRMEEKYISGLLTEPDVAVCDQNGQAVELVYDEKTRTYSQSVAESATIGDSDYATVLSAAQAYCKFMIGAAGKDELKACFDSTAPIYTTIIKNETWMQGYSSYAFGEENITDYYRYSDSLYSARVALTLNVTRGDGSIKPYDLNTTFFLTRSGDNWRVTEMTNVNVQEQTETVRLTYVCDGATVGTELVDAAAHTLTPPTVTVPDGKVFSGWFTETVDEKGNKTMSLAFLPDDTGSVTLPSGSTLEPMTFYALFETEAQ